MPRAAIAAIFLKLIGIKINSLSAVSVPNFFFGHSL